MHDTILMTALAAAILLALPVAAFLAALPIILAYAAHAQARFRRLLAAAAETLRCPACGSHLRGRAVDAADDVRRERLAEFRRAFPHHKLPRFRPLDAVCPACGVGLAYRGEPRRFERAETSA